MPVKIRLARVGRSKVMKYRVVAADSRMSRDGRFLETIGSYDPQAVPKKFVFDLERTAYWIKNGAQPTLTVRNLLREDRFFEKVEGLQKGLTAEQLNVERKAERKRKPKPKKQKS
ncbi:MAG TPA: 30S ribosomal protein S16 [Chitinispirillaceae bacterium]|nr:30S ribosomal protein S16 [Chitinispirillaceae bacterium]